MQCQCNLQLDKLLIDVKDLFANFKKKVLWITAGATSDVQKWYFVFY